jgi:hypothetical protein
MSYEGPLPLVEKAGGTHQSTYTTGDTLYASAANTLSKLAIGTAGQVMTVAGGVPSWAAGGGGGVAGFASTVSTTATSTATSLAQTGTVPTTSNTTSLTSVTYTPTSSSNKLKFDFSCPVSVSTGAGAGFFLFQGTTLLAAFPCISRVTGEGGTVSFTYVATAGTTSSTTYSVYYACDGAGTVYLLSYVGTAYYGAAGSSSYTFSVTEYA